MKSAIFSGRPKKLKSLLIRRVSGASMLPTLRDGQIIIARSADSYKVGAIVLIRHDGMEKIKRIQAVRSMGMRREIYVIGDNRAQSTDSRTFGWLAMEDVQAQLIWPRRK